MKTSRMIMAVFLSLGCTLPLSAAVRMPKVFSDNMVLQRDIAIRVWVWADARINRDTVLLSSPEVPKPVAVRYAYADNPICNLYNKAGLPAYQFATDRMSKPQPAPDEGKGGSSSSRGTR